MSDLDRIRARLADGEPVRWLFTGDSITHGAAHTNGARDYVQLFEERIRWELRRVRDHVLRTAISGRTAPDLESDLEWSTLQYRPHALSLMFGLNDANTPHPDPKGFEGTLDRLIGAGHEIGALVIVHTPNRTIATDTVERRANLAAYAGAARNAAASTGAILVDNHADWEAAELDGSIECWIDHGCHPNAEGHRVLHRTLARTLGLWDASSPTGRLFIP